MEIKKTTASGHHGFNSFFLWRKVQRLSSGHQRIAGAREPRPGWTHAGQGSLRSVFGDYGGDEAGWWNQRFHTETKFHPLLVFLSFVGEKVTRI